MKPNSLISDTYEVIDSTLDLKENKPLSGYTDTSMEYIT
jgi:hypothetical protein